VREEVLLAEEVFRRLVPDVVLVGASSVSVPEVALRSGIVLDAVEATDGWATSVRASKPPWTIMRDLGGVESGFRALRRSRPLEAYEVDLGDGTVAVAPTAPEALRVKAYLVVQRNAARDYLDLVTLADHLVEDDAVGILTDIDQFYVDRSGENGSVLTSLVIALADPRPRDTDVIDELPRYKGLDARWHDWTDVVAACRQLALRLSGAA